MTQIRYAIGYVLGVSLIVLMSLSGCSSADRGPAVTFNYDCFSSCDQSYRGAMDDYRQCVKSCTHQQTNFREAAYRESHRYD